MEETIVDDGGLVAERRKPEEIAREIEQTRAELADTIDAIAGRMSPKRAVARGTQRVRSRVSPSTSGTAPATPAVSVDEPAPASAVIDLTEPVAHDVDPKSVDPKLLVAGAAAGAAVGLLALRRRK